MSAENAYCWLCGEAVASAGTPDDYPYDASLRPEDLYGLDKLRTIEHRPTAREAFELHWAAEHYSVCRKSRARERAKAADSTTEELIRLKLLAQAASRGDWGQLGIASHDTMFRDNGWGSEPKYDLQSLRVFERDLRESGAQRVEKPEQRQQRRAR